MAAGPWLCSRPGAHHALSRTRQVRRQQLTAGIGRLLGHVSNRLLGALAPGVETGAPRGHASRQRLHLRSHLLELAGHRRGDEDRGVRAGQRPDEEREGEVLEGSRSQETDTDDQDRRDGEQRHDRGVDGPDQCLVERQVGGLAVSHPVARGDVPGVLTHLVEHHDGVVERETENGEEGDHRGWRDLEAEHRVHADAQQHVVQHGDDGGYRHSPLESPGDEHRNEHQEHDERSNGLLGDGGAPRRTDQLRGDLVDLHANLLGEGLLHLGTHRLRLVAHLHLDAALAGVGSEDLHLRSSTVEAVGGEHCTGISLGQGVARHLPQHTAAELEAQVEATGDQRTDADQQQQRRDTQADPAAAVEVDRGLTVVETTEHATATRHRGLFGDECVGHAEAPWGTASMPITLRRSIHFVRESRSTIGRVKK